MNNKHYRLAGISLLLLGLIVSNTLLAQDITILSASPEEAEQGTFAQEISITGSGFDKSVREVRFLVHCDPASPDCIDDPGGITVTGFSVRNSTKIAATIDVADNALVKSYDIAVTTRGRGGKGTTFRSAEALFTVKLRPNQELVMCDELLKDPLGSCTCLFSWDGNEDIYGLLDNCVTSETLRFKPMVRTAGSVQAGGTERLSITAVLCNTANGQVCDETSGVAPGTFKGSAVIENWFHRARIRYLDIRFGSGASAPSRGCEKDDIRSAVSFVLRKGDVPDPNRDTPDPRTALPEDNPDSSNRNSVFFVFDIGIYSEDDPLCNAVEVIREQAYTDAYSDADDPEPARDWKVSIEHTQISAGSYVNAGIVMLGIMPTEGINPVYVFGNAIGAPACGEGAAPDSAIAILLGGFQALDALELAEGVVESNIINMNCPDSMESHGTGVLLVGNVLPGRQTTAKLNKNDISGAMTGIGVDGDVVEAGFSGNTLTGDVDDIGICSYAEHMNTKGKPNHFSGYGAGNEIQEGGCVLPAW